MRGRVRSTNAAMLFQVHRPHFINSKIKTRFGFVFTFASNMSIVTSKCCKNLPEMKFSTTKFVFRPVYIPSWLHTFLCLSSVIEARV